MTFEHELDDPYQDQSSHNDQLDQALIVAKMYYYQELTTNDIAKAMRLSRPKVSRLLRFARKNGLIEVRIHDPRKKGWELEHTLETHYGLKQVHVVPCPDTSSEQERLTHCAKFTAKLLLQLLNDGMTLGIAWGTTISEISTHLIPRAFTGVEVVQLNGSGNTHNISNTYASEILMRFASCYGATTHLFPVPAFFDYAETKTALWCERSVKTILKKQQGADLLLYSIGAFNAGIPSHVHAGGYLEQADLTVLQEAGVVGDIATVFFRHDGSYADIKVNQRASGPALDLFSCAPHSICVVSGNAKVNGLQAALKGGYVNTLVVDMITARELLAR